MKTAEAVLVEGRDWRGSAVFSFDYTYRYRLSRVWGPASRMVFVMLNPSTADATHNDPTITRCMGFARREGLGGIVVVNLFALRVTRPVHLFDGTVGDDPNGLSNQRYVDGALYGARADAWPIVCAWGANKRVDESEAWQTFFKSPAHPHLDLLCLGTNKDGSPCHPLYLDTDTPLIPWEAQ